MSDKILQRVRIVMVYTSHPGNIGAAARAMKNMGLSQLVLVAPADFPGYEACQRAAGADDILNQATVVETLEQALQGCVFVAGTSARSRTIDWSVYSPEDCAQTCLTHAADADCDVAVVFGRERSGLTNKELELCNALVHIPTSEVYSSLNVAAAVQILCYELRRTALKNVSAEPLPQGKKHSDDVLASMDALAGLYQHLFSVLEQVRFFGTHEPDIVMRRIKGLFNRAGTTQREVAIFRGICSAIQGRKYRRDKH